MKTDRELLELAAKAIDLDATYKRCSDAVWGYVILHPNGTGHVWNPLTDDGDAFRLAVKLGLEVYHSINCNEWTAFVGYPSQQRILYVNEGYGADPLAATRRAIVLAAAQMAGKCEVIYG